MGCDGIHLEYAWNTMEHTSNMHGITWNTMDYIWNMHGIRWDINEYVWNHIEYDGIHMVYAWHNTGCDEYAWTTME